MSEPLALVGRAVVEWNCVEERLSRLLWLYLNTDRQTFDIVTSGMRPLDCEKMLKRLVAAKEPRTEIQEEISFMLLCCGILRENRNIVIHAVTQMDEQSSKVCDVLANFASQLIGFISYLENLTSQILIQMNDRSDRIIYEDESSDKYEATPVPVFGPLKRPGKPTKINRESLQ